jgi:predicted dehydrogenase
MHITTNVMAPTRSKIALIGCGRIGFLLEQDRLRHKPCTHFGGATSAGLIMTHACDINRDRLHFFGQQAGIPRENLYRDYRKLLKEVRPELVIIATWTESHEAIAIEAARCGARAIVLEKPMASTLNGCRRILDRCHELATPIIICHERRYDNRYRKTKEMITAGKIGPVKTVHASILTAGYHGASRMAEGGGPLLHDGTHLVDMIRYLFGEITAAEGAFQRNGRASGFEDRALAWLTTEQKVDIFLEAGGNRNYFVFELEISGSEGKIIIGNGYQKLFLGRPSRLYAGFRDIVERPFPRYKKNNCFHDLYREARRVLKGDTAIASTGTDGYRALEAIHAIYLSSHLDRKKISLPLDQRNINLKKIFDLQ